MQKNLNFSGKKQLTLGPNDNSLNAHSTVKSNVKTRLK